MKKFITIFILLSLITISCNQNHNSIFEYKKWHNSPYNSPLSSTIYPYIEWEDVLKIKVGLKEKNAGFKFQYYHHPINAIIFTKSPQNDNYEIALKLSEDKKEITDISFLKLD